MTIEQWVNRSGLPSKNASTIVKHVLNPKSQLDGPSFLASHSHDILSLKQATGLNTLKKRYLTGEPLAYVIGNSMFGDINLLVDNRVLIPRQETEELVQLVIKRIKTSIEPLTIAEIGTGSGAISLTLAKWSAMSNRPLHIIATDISADAVAVAQKNSALVKLNQYVRLDFRTGSLLEPIDEKLDLIVANLPYIPTHWLEHLDKNVVDFEPEVALDGGPDGLTLINQLLDQAPLHLKRGGCIFLEIWHEHAERDFARFDQLDSIVVRDSFGKNRFAILRLIDQ